METFVFTVFAVYPIFWIFMKKDVGDMAFKIMKGVIDSISKHDKITS